MSRLRLPPCHVSPSPGLEPCRAALAGAALQLALTLGQQALQQGAQSSPVALVSACGSPLWLAAEPRPPNRASVCSIGHPWQLHLPTGVARARTWVGHVAAIYRHALRAHACCRWRRRPRHPKLTQAQVTCPGPWPQPRPWLTPPSAPASPRQHRPPVLNSGSNSQRQV